MRGLLILGLILGALDCATDSPAMTAPSFSEAGTFAWRATCGSVTQTGFYTAPASGTCYVIATSQATGLADTSRVIVATGRGLAAGYWNYPPDQWCVTPLAVSALSRPFETDELLVYLQDAKRCGVRLALVPARRDITTTGANKSPFSLDSAKAFTDRMARVLTPDTLAKYDGQIIGFNLADDYGCAECWGGVKVTPTQIEAWATYVRTKIPGLRLGVRVEPAWPTTTLAAKIDYAWAQYHTGKGDAQAYFDKTVADAKAKGLALAMGVNVKYCGGANTGPCTPTQVKTYMGLAVSYPQNCAALGWEWLDGTPTQEMRDAWAYVLGLAAGKPEVVCRHG